MLPYVSYVCRHTAVRRIQYGNAIRVPYHIVWRRVYSAVQCIILYMIWYLMLGSTIVWLYIYCMIWWYDMDSYPIIYIIYVAANIRNTVWYVFHVQYSMAGHIPYPCMYHQMSYGCINTVWFGADAYNDIIRMAIKFQFWFDTVRIMVVRQWRPGHLSLCRNNILRCCLLELQLLALGTIPRTVLLLLGN